MSFCFSSRKASVSHVHAAIDPMPVMCSAMRNEPPLNFLGQLLHCTEGQVSCSTSTVTVFQIGPSRFGSDLRFPRPLDVETSLSRPRRLAGADAGAGADIFSLVCLCWLSLVCGLDWTGLNTCLM